MIRVINVIVRPKFFSVIKCLIFSICYAACFLNFDFTQFDEAIRINESFF